MYETIMISKLVRLRGDFEMVVDATSPVQLKSSEISLRVKQIDDEEEY